MKVVTFFSEKGGVGKTVLTYLFANYLAYERGENVKVMDLDHPMFQLAGIRSDERAILARESDKLGAGDTLPYNCLTNLVKDIEPYEVIRGPEGSRLTDEQYLAIRKKIEHYRQAVYPGYLFLDFSGNLLADEPANRTITDGLVDAVILPVEQDSFALASALYVHKFLTSDELLKKAHKSNIPHWFLWNKDSAYLRAAEKKTSYYQKVETSLKMLGVQFVSKKVKEIRSFGRDAESTLFMRTTMCWPKTTIRMRCPDITDVFSELKDRIDGKWKEPIESNTK